MRGCLVGGRIYSIQLDAQAMADESKAAAAQAREAVTSHEWRETQLEQRLSAVAGERDQLEQQLSAVAEERDVLMADRLQSAAEGASLLGALRHCEMQLQEG